MWRERLEANVPWTLEWLHHQRRDDYWRQGSVCGDFSRIACAVYAVSGWGDNYNEAVPRLVAGLDAPVIGLSGTWCHQYPNRGYPGPAIGFLQEIVRWWDHWLKGIKSGIMDEPAWRAWIQESPPPATSYEERPGHWVGELSWPNPNTDWQRWIMNPDRLDRESGELILFGLSLIPYCKPWSPKIECTDWFSQLGRDRVGEELHHQIACTSSLDGHAMSSSAKAGGVTGSYAPLTSRVGMSLSTGSNSVASAGAISQISQNDSSSRSDQIELQIP